jgi:ribosome-binding protein aMBF1 (putative translation factor)
MAQLAALPEDSWRQVVCRICGHPFAIAVEDAQSAAVLLCQTCSILVEWFGQEEAPPLPAPQPAEAKTVQKRAGKARERESQQAQLGSLLERWGEIWRSSEEQE